jgi:hypothetical protein
MANGSLGRRDIFAEILIDTYEREEVPFEKAPKLRRVIADFLSSRKRLDSPTTAVLTEIVELLDEAIRNQQAVSFMLSFGTG